METKIDCDFWHVHQLLHTCNIGLNLGLTESSMGWDVKTRLQWVTAIDGKVQNYPAVPRSLTTVLTTRLSRRLFVTFNLSPLLLCFIVEQYLKLHVKWWSVELNQNVWCIWTFNFNSLHFLTTLVSAFCMIRSLSFKNSPAGWQFSWNINKEYWGLDLGLLG